MNLYSIPIFWVYFFRMGVKFYQNHFLIIWYDHVVLLLKLIWWNTLMDLWKLISGVPLEYISLGHNVWCFHILLSLLANILIKIVVFILWFRYHGGVFPAQGLNPDHCKEFLYHCRQFLYHLSHQGSPGNTNFI